MLKQFWNGVMIGWDGLEGMAREEFMYYMELKSVSDGKWNQVEEEEKERQFELAQILLRLKEKMRLTET